MDTHILLITCVDQKGLVYKITGVLYEHNLNIVSNGEFVEQKTGRFFMRTEFSGKFAERQLLRGLREALPDGVQIQLVTKQKKDIVILVTKESHCLGDLLIRNTYNELNANICAVIGNHDTLKPLVEKFDLPYHHINHEGKKREAHESEMLTVMDAYKPEYVVLAKYMRILTSAFISRYKNRLINIHHSFLPAFIGANPYKQAFERGVKIIGATAHFVTDDLDQGPIIAQSVIPVDHTHSLRDMIQAGRDVEKIVLAKALKLTFEDRIFVSGNRTIIFD